MTAGFVAGARARVSPVRAAVPDLSAYEAWFKEAALTAPARNKRFTAIDARLIRRIVMMRREDYSFSDIGRSIGHSQRGAHHAYHCLPDHLR